MKYPRCCICRTEIFSDPIIIAKQMFCPCCGPIHKKRLKMIRRYRRNPCDQEARKFLGLPTNELKELRIDL